MTVLQAASAGGHLEILRPLLNKTADVNAPGIFHGTALQAALAGGHQEIVQLLFDTKADLNAQ